MCTLCLLLLLTEGFIQMEAEQNESSSSPKRPSSGSDESVEPSPCKRPRIQEEVCDILCPIFFVLTKMFHDAAMLFTFKFFKTTDATVHTILSFIR